MTMAESIMATLGIDTNPFRNGLKQAQAQVDSFAAGVSGKFSSAFGAAAIGAGAAMMAKAAVDYADRLRDLSEILDVSAVALLRMDRVAVQSGSSLDALAAMMGKLRVAAAKALGGDEDVAAKLQTLGVSVDDLKSLSADEVMAKIGQGSMNAAAMVAILGRNANSAKVALAALAEESKKGLADDADIKRVSDFADAVARLRVVGMDALIYGSRGVEGLLTGAGLLGSSAQGAVSGLLSGGLFGAIKGAAGGRSQYEDAIVADELRKLAGAGTDTRKTLAESVGAEAGGTSPAAASAAKAADDFEKYFWSEMEADAKDAQEEILKDARAKEAARNRSAERAAVELDARLRGAGMGGAVYASLIGAPGEVRAAGRMTEVDALRQIGGGLTAGVGEYDPEALTRDQLKETQKTNTILQRIEESIRPIDAAQFAEATGAGNTA